MSTFILNVCMRRYPCYVLFHYFRQIEAQNFHAKKKTKANNFPDICTQLFLFKVFTVRCRG